MKGNLPLEGMKYTVMGGGGAAAIICDLSFKFPKLSCGSHGYIPFFFMFFYVFIFS